jgi:hypothetical protein
MAPPSSNEIRVRCTNGVRQSTMRIRDDIASIRATALASRVIIRDSREAIDRANALLGRQPVSVEP